MKSANRLRRLPRYGGETLGRRRGTGLSSDETFESARTRPRRAPAASRKRAGIGARLKDDIQFGKPMLSFPRVADKIALMASRSYARHSTIRGAREDAEPLRSRGGMASCCRAVAWLPPTTRADPWRQRFATKFRCRAARGRAHSQHFEGGRRDSGASVSRVGCSTAEITRYLKLDDGGAR